MENTLKHSFELSLQVFFTYIVSAADVILFLFLFVRDKKNQLNKNKQNMLDK